MQGTFSSCSLAFHVLHEVAHPSSPPMVKCTRCLVLWDPLHLSQKGAFSFAINNVIFTFACQKSVISQGQLQTQPRAHSGTRQERGVLPPLPAPCPLYHSTIPPCHSTFHSGAIQQPGRAGRECSHTPHAPPTRCLGQVPPLHNGRTATGHGRH